MDISAVSDQTKIICTFKLYALSNLTLSFSSSHNNIILCSVLFTKTQLSVNSTNP